MRSYLIFPANNVNHISKAVASDADVLIFDLEDSVNHSSKNEARNNLKIKTKNIKPIL